MSTAVFPIASSQDNSNHPLFARSAVGMGTAAGIVIKALPGRAYKFRGINGSAGVVYMMLFDKATAPANGDTPIARLPLAATTGAGELDYGLYGRGCLAGIGIAFSSTADTLTLAGGVLCHYEVMYK